MAENQQGRAGTMEQLAAMIRGLNLFSDLFMSTALQDQDACEYVLRKVLQWEDLKITNVKTQWRLPNLTSKDSILDVFAEEESGNSIFNLEDQRSSTVAHEKRTRYYMAMLDKSSLDKGKEYDELPDVYVIYVSERDIWKQGKTVYLVEQKFQETGEIYDDGTHLIYVNAEIDDGSEVAAMMRYFKTADPEDMSQGALSERVRYLKTEKGEKEMCEVADKIYSMGEASGKAEGRAAEIVDIYREEGRSDQFILEKLQSRLHIAADQAMEFLVNYGKQPA